MAARRIKANLCKEEPKRSSFAHLNQPSSKERKLSPVGLIALMVGALRFIPLPSLVITLSLSMRVQTPSVLTKALSLPLNAMAASTRPWMPSTRYLSRCLMSTPPSLATRLSASSTPSTTSLSLVAASLVLRCTPLHLSSLWLVHYQPLSPPSSRRKKSPS